MTTDSAVMVAVVGLRALLPILILRAPLPGVLACLVLDAVDQTIFAGFGVVPPDYEAYDKAMDTYYLCLAYLAVLRNWTSFPAVRIAQVLLAVRLVGAFAFELEPWPPLLVLFPNVFEYFFIAHELVRTRWSSNRLRTRGWLVIAAAIWLLVKLPQEWWIHVAHLDVTDFVASRPWWSVPPLAVLVLALAVLWLLRGRLFPPPDHPLRLLAGPLPADLDDPHKEAGWEARHDRLLALAMTEKVLLVVTLVGIYGHVVPGTDATEPQLLIGSGVLAAINAGIVVVVARRRWTPHSVLVAAGGRLLVNAVVLGLLDLAAIGVGAAVDVAPALLFLALITVVSALHDRCVPVYAYRRRRAEGVTRGRARRR